MELHNGRVHYNLPLQRMWKNSVTKCDRMLHQFSCPYGHHRWHDIYDVRQHRRTVCTIQLTPRDGTDVKIQRPSLKRSLRWTTSPDQFQGRSREHMSYITAERSFWSGITTGVGENTSQSNQINTTHQQKPAIQVLSKYDAVELEEYIYANVTSVVCDPVLGLPLSTLKWLQKRISISYSTETDTSSKLLIEQTNDDERIHNSLPVTVRLSFQLRLPSLLHPKLNELRELIKDHALKHAQQWWTEKRTKDAANSNYEYDTNMIQFQVEVLPIVQPTIPIMSRFVEDAAELLYNLGPGLTSVTHCIAVYSCKGGVGKSTIAVNLAYELAAAGGRIGLLDLDLYGPSLPVLVRPKDCTIRRSPLGTGLVYPITHENVKLLSLGFVNTHSGVPGSGLNNGASIMKGPMAVKVVSQLLKGTDWGALDVLILDLPPGTGDVQLAVLQQLQLSGAVAVTTPSKLATTDTRKGIEMFTSLGVPTIAVVENMSYFDDDSGKRHYPFGNGFAELQHNSSVRGANVKVVQLPISIATNNANDDGIPLTITRTREATKELTAYKKLADIVSEELLRLQYGPITHDETAEFVTFDAYGTTYFDVANVSLVLDKTKGNEKLIVRLYSESNATQFPIPSPSDLRSRDPKTGDTITDSPYLNQTSYKDTMSSHSQDPVVKVTKRSPSVIPVKERRGRYGFAVEWADGATIIYSMRSLARAAGGKLKKHNS
jgi:Mrp family chromosome partitioning ATPase